MENISFINRTGAVSFRGGQRRRFTGRQMSKMPRSDAATDLFSSPPPSSHSRFFFCSRLNCLCGMNSVIMMLTLFIYLLDILVFMVFVSTFANIPFTLTLICVLTLDFHVDKMSPYDIQQSLQYINTDVCPLAGAVC